MLLGSGMFSLGAQEPAGLESTAKAVLEKRCLTCHNAQMKTAGLILSSLENALKGGSKGPALVPRKPDESLIWQRISAGQMPPANPLSAEEREVIRQWIESGAPWTGVIGKAVRPRAGPDWWSLQPLRVSSPPDPEGISAEWSRGAIDRFIYAKLAEKKLQPSGPADRRTYIRRATFDLLGLPPTPEEVEAFVGDNSAEAYQKLIDRLLASPHYGERWGRHWLDVIRFGESHGYEQNHLREHAWPFRDYVIRSFNEDKPFNRMIVEQLAGDQVATGNPAVEVATGFLVAGIHDTVKIENIEGELVKRANDLDDFLSTAGAAFLGLTVNCARCHDHKFDPILQADYYRFQSVFAGVEHAERALATTAEIERHRAVEEPLREQVKSIDERFAALKGQGEALVKQRREEIARQYKPPVDSRGTEEVFDPTQARFIRMTIEDSTKNSPPAIDELEVWTAGPVPVNVALASNGTRAKARSTRSTMTATEAYQVENLTDGKFDKLWISGEDGKGQITLEFPRPQNVTRIFWSRDRLGGQQGRFLGQVATRYIFEASLDGVLWRKLTDSVDRLPYEEEAREEFFLLSVLSAEQKSEWTSLKERRAGLEKQLAQIPAIPAAYIGRFVQPKEPTHLLKRGNPMDKGEVIAPASLSTLKSMLPGFELPADAPEGQRRLALARWIADDRNALTARVIVNRIWHYHFGKGLVGTPSDFGFNGERPTHPELLDWMARRFIELGWRLKPFHRELMLSAAYRQAGTANEKAAAVDSEARYLWRFPPKRLEAEAVRDSLLAVTGKLNLSIGGPGFQLYKYTVDNVATYLPLETSSPETFRRSVYHQAARSVRDDMLGTHDCPDSTIPEPKRVVTTTPLQALTLLNSSFILDQARYFAERLEREAGKNRTVQIERAFRLAFGRAPKPAEAAAAAALIGEHGLAVFCRALLNANEFVYVM
jgi:hypothetical protein